MTTTAETICDVTIVGGGAAGSFAAIALARQGLSVALIDLHANHPPEFRCEKIATDQLELLARLDLVHVLDAISTPISHMHVVRAGAIHERLQSDEFGFYYQDFINELRRNLPTGATFVVGRVQDIKNARGEQLVTLADGRTFRSRLVVVATGLGNGLRQKLGIERRMLVEQHSLCMALTIKPESGCSFGFPGLTYYAERPSDRMAYVSIFPIRDRMRANIFGYRGYRDPFVAGMRKDPVATLYGVMPGLQKYLGRMTVEGDVQVRMVDLYVTENFEQDGVVLIGDAFATSCPAAGTGLTRCMNDVERLAALAPALFATPGMGKEKLATFYADPIKQTYDAKSAYAASYTRRFATDRGIEWGLRRLKANLRARVHATLAGTGEPFANGN